MNHPRRLLLLVPLALLGAAWLVRAHLPRPQTEGDKWLWEQGEATPTLILNNAVGQPDTSPRRPRGGFTSVVYSLTVSDRQGIRRLLRSLEGTPAFTPLPKGHQFFTPIDYSMSLGPSNWVWITHQGKSFFLRRQDRKIARLTPSALAHFRQAFGETLLKAKQHQAGYSLSPSFSYTL